MVSEFFTLIVSAALDAVGDRVDGVFGGLGGLGGVYLLNELDRGACGSMPAPPFADALVQAWNGYQAGDPHGARDLLVPLGGLFALELQYNVAVSKHMLHRRDVIAHTTCRVPAPALDDVDRRELDELLARAGIAA